MMKKISYAGFVFNVLDAFVSIFANMPSFRLYIYFD
jgi:hypothetical protein